MKWLAFAVFVFLAAPLVVILATAFSASALLVFPPEGISLRWFAAFFERRDFREGLVTSVLVAVPATVLATSMGTATAIGLHQAPGKLARAIEGVVLSSLFYPLLVLALGITLLFNRLTIAGSYPALVLAEAFLGLPLAFRVVASGLANFPAGIEAMAASLGASPSRVFRSVTIPVLRSAIAGAFLLVLLVVFNESLIALFLRGPDLVTLPVEMFGYIRFRIDPLLAASSAIFVLATILVLLVVQRVAGLGSLTGGRD